MRSQRLALTIWFAIMVAISLPVAAVALPFGPPNGIDAARAQDAPAATSTPAAPAPTGELVVVPNTVQLGQTTLAVGFHVDPLDLEVAIHYSEHFTPEGQECDDTAPGATQPAPAPTWVTLEACSVGEGYVRLIVSATGHVIEEVSVAVAPQGPTGLSDAEVTLSGVTSAELVPGGSSDRFTVNATGLESNKVYELNTVVLNGVSAAFDSGCTTFKATSTIRLANSANRRYDAYGCAAPGSYLWAWVEDVDGDTIASSGLTDHFLNVADPTVSFSSSSYSVKEGTSTAITVSLSHPTGHRLRIPVTVANGTAESDDYSVSGLTTVRNELTFEPHDTSESFTITASQDTDNDEGDETVNLGFGTLPSDVSSGTTRTATLTIGNVNTAPVISGRSEVSYAENGIADVETYTATDVNGDSITWSLSGIDDDDLSITRDGGVLTFRRTPNFESPRDHGRNNKYEVTVTANDGNQGTDEVDVVITVTDVNESPDITRGPESVFYQENRTADVGEYTATDPDTGDSITWSLTGADAGDFNISDDGELSFDAPPDFESPTDSGGNNVYNVTVRARDSGRLSDDRDVTITVTNVNERPTLVSGIADRTMTAGTTATISLSHTFSDPDGDALSYTARSSNTRVATTTVSGSTLSLAAISAGSATITVTAFDGGGLSATNHFTVTVAFPPLDTVTGLTATSGAVHGEIALDWDPVDEADSYEVGQWTRQVGGVFSWEVLDDPSEVRIDLANTSAVVHGLTGGLSYEHNVRAVRGTGSHIVKGHWADGEDATALDESPSTPMGLQGGMIRGGRGIVLEWNPVADAVDYEVERSFDGGVSTTTVTLARDEATALTPGVSYSFRVRSRKPHGGGYLHSAWSVAVSRIAPTPANSGHQEDHTVAYEVGTIVSAPNPPSGVPNPAAVIRDSIEPAASAWNSAAMAIAGKNLSICESSTSTSSATTTCGTRNHDRHKVTVRSVALNTMDANVGDPNKHEEGCGRATACVKMNFRPSPVGPGHHLSNMSLIIEEPAWECVGGDPMSGTCALHLRIYWTDVQGDHATALLTSGSNPTLIGIKYHIGDTMIHEFGHTLGLPDFKDEDSFKSFEHLSEVQNAIMFSPDAQMGITDEDIEQLKAIYALHESASH